MTRALNIALVTFIMIAWGQVQFTRGFNTGSDTTLCVIDVVKSDMTKRPKDVPACQRVWKGDPSLSMLRGWRQINGDAATVDDVRGAHP